MQKPSLATPPPEPSLTLDDGALLAALDGVADERTREHLSTCRACTARARVYAALQRDLQRRLFRLFCPASEELAAFQQRALDPARSAEIAQHRNECPHCARELQLLGAVLGASPPEDAFSNEPHSQRAGPADDERC